jgi:hypothetical protein
VQQVTQAVRRGQVEPRATLRGLSYFAEEVLFSVFRAESGTHMFLALVVWRTPLGVDGGENVKTFLTPLIRLCENRSASTL